MAIPLVVSMIPRGKDAEVISVFGHHEVDIRRDEELMIARSVCRVFGPPAKTPES